ncbi:MAG: phenylacetate-CoA oxygenase subunit PaaJ [Calditrichaeota bacterium]|nr:MAG: phenylacetate-CoA oxygenase subunit PaaJ [Calditrichota bacterium]
MKKEEQIIQALRQVKDPEVPVLDIVEMGIVRGVEITESQIIITITPTYTGCPAMRVIEEEINQVLKTEGYENVEVKTVLFPAWTTDWLTEEARLKLKAYGIAPPEKVNEVDLNPFNWEEKKVACPFCESMNTSLTSQFGSTACKALYYCNNCQQPFEHFKCI